jgi:hypothetical protein
MGNSGAIARGLNARKMLAGGEVLEEFHTRWLSNLQDEHASSRAVDVKRWPSWDHPRLFESCDDGGGINCMTHPRIARRLEVPAFDTDPKLPKGRGLSERQLHRVHVHVLYLGTEV